MPPRPAAHTHQPVFRVVRAGWPDPLDTTFSRRAPDNRWNTADFGALYCCCSGGVARGVTRDRWRISAVEAMDLQWSFQPSLVEIGWSGNVVDVASTHGIAAAGFPPSYPAGVSKLATRSAAAEWHGAGAEGVMCRSASLERLGHRAWTGTHEPWSELAIFVEVCRVRPTMTRRVEGVDWLRAGTGP